jgi:hypothetical protein
MPVHFITTYRHADIEHYVLCDYLLHSMYVQCTLFQKICIALGYFSVYYIVNLLHCKPDFNGVLGRCLTSGSS